MANASEIGVEVVYALPTEQVVLELRVPLGTTARSAIELSGILTRFPEIRLADNPIGVYGRVVDPDRVLEDGDRVEIYRPLEMDPREARRLLAEKGLSMGSKRRL